MKEHNNFLTDQEYHLIAHKAAQIPDTFIDYKKRDGIHVFKLLVFFGVHPSKARLNITQTQQVIKEQNLHPKKLAINIIFMILLM